MARRPYTKQQRARQEEQTRERIVAAAAALHGEVGPRDTTVSAIAQRAGVQRLTVYRHFPDSGALFRACSAHWLERNPPPDRAAWAGLEAPAPRTRAALAALYGYYRETAYMWERAYRDRDAVPAMEEPMRRFEAWLDELRDDLAGAWGPGAGPRGRAVLGHALRFRCWQSLAGEGLGDGAIADAMVTWLFALAAEAGNGGPAGG